MTIKGDIIKHTHIYIYDNNNDDGIYLQQYMQYDEYNSLKMAL